jgi:hypothetical protein
MTRRVHLVDVVAAAAPLLFSLVTLGMVAVSLLAGRRVTHILAERVTRMDHRGGCTANLVVASLVVDYCDVARYLWSSQCPGRALVRRDVRVAEPFARSA